MTKPRFLSRQPTLRSLARNLAAPRHARQALAATAWLGLALTVGAQSWQTILPSPGFSQEGTPWGRSLLAEPSAPAGSLPGLYLGVVDYSGSPTLFRLRPDDPGFQTTEIVGVDNRLPFVSQMLHVPGQGLYAVGRIEVKSKRSTKYYWQVRRSPGGDPGTWVDVGQAYIYPGKLSDDSYAHGIAADDQGNLFVSGLAEGSPYPNGRDFWRWIVRRKLAGALDSQWQTVLDQSCGDMLLRPGTCFFPGNDRNTTKAILTAGNINRVWTVLRSQNGGASWHSVDPWPEMQGIPNSAHRIECDAASGNLYALGWRGTLTDKAGWLVRMSRDGGDSWETLLDEPAERGGASGLAFHPDGSVFLTGSINPTGTFPILTVVRKTPDQSWADSWAQRMAPLSDSLGNPFTSPGSSAIAVDGSGNVLVTGDVTDWVEDGVAYPGTRLFLRRLPGMP